MYKVNLDKMHLIDPKKTTLNDLELNMAYDALRIFVEDGFANKQHRQLLIDYELIIKVPGKDNNINDDNDLTNK